MKPLPSPNPWALLLALPTLGRRGHGTLPPGPQLWTAQPVAEAHWRHFGEALEYPALTEPPLCFHYLALQRTQLQLMLEPGFPYPVPGMVHMAQTLTRTAPWQLDAPWQIAQTLAAIDTPQGAKQLRCTAEFTQGSTVVLRAESLYLARRAPRSAASNKPAGPAPAAPACGAPLAEWALPAAAGRRYAQLSGDWNPIHLWPWSARLLGQRRPIIHGMHSAARCEAELARHVGRPLQSLSIRFQRPLALPGRAVLCGDTQTFAQTFTLTDAPGRVVASGQFA